MRSLRPCLMDWFNKLHFTDRTLMNIKKALLMCLQKGLIYSLWMTNCLYCVYTVLQTSLTIVVTSRGYFKHQFCCAGQGVLTQSACVDSRWNRISWTPNFPRVLISSIIITRRFERKLDVFDISIRCQQLYFRTWCGSKPAHRYTSSKVRRRFTFVKLRLRKPL